jgi:alkylhydroperoxidase/carboxymuconolactone decarboxylase family protein YurZ
MTDSPLRAKGRAMRRNLMGAAYADKLDRQLYTDPIMEKFAALTQETVFGSLWTRPELDLKTRTLICVVSDTATGRTPELKLHIRFARNHGWAEDELVEAILHSARLCRRAPGARGAASREGDLCGDACRESGHVITASLQPCATLNEKTGTSAPGLRFHTARA